MNGFFPVDECSMAHGATPVIVKGGGCPEAADQGAIPLPGDLESGGFFFRCMGIAGGGGIDDASGAVGNCGRFLFGGGFPAVRLAVEVCGIKSLAFICWERLGNAEVMFPND